MFFHQVLCLERAEFVSSTVGVLVRLLSLLLSYWALQAKYVKMKSMRCGKVNQRHTGAFAGIWGWGTVPNVVES